MGFPSGLKNIKKSLMNDRYSCGVDYIFDQSNKQVLENIHSIFKCLENKLNIHPEFIYYNNNKDYSNMLKILYNFKDKPFLKKYNSCKNIIIENNLLFLEYTTILQYLYENITTFKRKR